MTLLRQETNGSYLENKKEVFWILLCTFAPLQSWVNRFCRFFQCLKKSTQSSLGVAQHATISVPAKSLVVCKKYGNVRCNIMLSTDCKVMHFVTKVEFAFNLPIS